MIDSIDNNLAYHAASVLYDKVSGQRVLQITSLVDKHYYLHITEDEAFSLISVLYAFVDKEDKTCSRE